MCYNGTSHCFYFVTYLGQNSTECGDKVLKIMLKLSMLFSYYFESVRGFHDLKKKLQGVNFIHTYVSLSISLSFVGSESVILY